jgi:deoxyribodipyrimidine photo-lyase
VLDAVLLRGPRAGAPVVQLFFDSLAALRRELRALGSDLALLEGDPATVLVAFARRAGATALWFNEDDDPDAAVRDEQVTRALRGAGVEVHACSDQVFFGANDVLQSSGKPYVVYTPYRRRWEARFGDDPRPPVPSARAVRTKLLGGDAIGTTRDVPAPEEYGRVRSDAYPRGGSAEAHRLLRRFVEDGLTPYAERRNVPALDGTSRLSPHLRAGTIGIRTVVHATRASAAFTGELIWRDFYHQLLHHYPHVAREPFLAAARRIAYRADETAFAAWCDGRTGYPIVDAAMAQLSATGWMHNRLRMIVASFLTKHLLIDYRAGERYFEQHLADADLAANNGGWQWAGSTGTDAAPYFRVFNPTLQGRTYDPDGAFVRSMIPALRGVPDPYVHEPWRIPPLLQAEVGCVIGRDYPAPIVDHTTARARALAAYAVLKKGGPAP